ncbi:MAG: lamin tail domain-containing protein [Patescibacteria group bacterium]
MVSLFYSYTPSHASGLLGYLGLSVTKVSKDINQEVQMSPSDMVTKPVTSKKVVTFQNVTSDNAMSPLLSPISYVTTTPVSSITINPPVTPTQPVAPLVSPVQNTHTLVPSPTPSNEVVTTGLVVINEIAWMGTGASSKLSNDEWMELYNPTSKTISLDGWVLKSLTGNGDPQISLSGSIGPNGYYLLERSDDVTIVSTLANKIYTGSLLDSGENLELRDSSGLLIDSVRCEGLWYAGNKGTRSSMERIKPNESGENSNNWGTNNGSTRNGQNNESGLVNGTPGAPNSIGSF